MLCVLRLNSLTFPLRMTYIYVFDTFRMTYIYAFWYTCLSSAITLIGFLASRSNKKKWKVEILSFPSIYDDVMFGSRQVSIASKQNTQFSRFKMATRKRPFQAFCSNSLIFWLVWAIFLTGNIVFIIAIHAVSIFLTFFVFLSW